MAGRIAGTYPFPMKRGAASIFALTLGLGLLSAPSAVAASALPVMVEGSGVFAKTTYSPGETVSFQYRITDDVGCCTYNQTSLWTLPGRNPDPNSVRYSGSTGSFVSGTATNGVYSASITIPSGITPGTWYVKAQAIDNDGGYTHVEALGSITVAPALQAALTPTFGVPVKGATGFTVQVSNHSASYAWTVSASAGSATITSSGLITVSGLTSGQSSTVSVGNTRDGYSPGSGTIASAALVADVELPVMVANSGVFPKSSYEQGEVLTFQYRITDDVGCCSYNVISLWTVGGKNPGGTPPYSSSSTRRISGTETDGVYEGTITLSNTLTPGTWYVKAQARDIATRYTHVEALGSIQVTAAEQPAKNATFGAVTKKPTGFTVNITNYDSAFTWSVTTSAGTAKISSAGLITVTGLSEGASATLQVKSVRTGYKEGAASVSGSAIAPDLELPVMVPNSGVFTKSEYKQGELLTVRYRITDDIGCCSYNVASLWTVDGRNPGGSPRYSTSSTRLVSGDEKDGIYEATFQLSESIPIGVWYVKAQARDLFTRYTHVEALGSVVIKASEEEALIPRLASPIQRTNEVSIRISNFDSKFTWSAQTTAGTASISAQGVITVSNLSADQSALLTVKTVREGYNDGVASLTLNLKSSTPAKKTPIKTKPQSPKKVELDDTHWEQLDTRVFEVLPSKVGGKLSADSAFLKKNSPFTISKALQIPSDVDIYVEEGVEIRVTTGVAFKIKGRIKIDGSAENPVKFTGTPNAWFAPSSTKASTDIDINYASFKGGKSLLPPTGNGGATGFKLRNSQVLNVPEYSYIWYPENDVVIEKNVFRNSGGFSIGFRGGADDSDKEVVVRNNLFLGKSTSGYWVEVWASYDSELLVTRNSFLNGPYTAVRIRPGGYDNAFLDAGENYWGTKSESGIQRMIMDAEDDLDFEATIDYSGWLTAAHADTPKGLIFK